MIEVYWMATNGVERSATGIGIDLSIFGMAVELPTAIPANTKVLVHIEGRVILGDVVVRYSRAGPASCRVGLEFERSLLGAGLPALDAVLIPKRGGFRSHSPELWCNWAVRALGSGIKKAGCLFTGHEFGWEQGASHDVLTCRRCQRALAIYTPI